MLADGFNGLLAALCTITPMSTFAQVSIQDNFVKRSFPQHFLFVFKKIIPNIPPIMSTMSDK